MPQNHARRIITTPAPATATLTKIPWPQGMAPTPAATVPAGAEALPAADVLLVTYTEAEAQACADVLTPGVKLSKWESYTHNYKTFLPKIKRGAPARSSKNLGLYWITTIGGKKVIVFKSSLHLSQDGPDLPIQDLWSQLIQEVAPSLVIATGTAGGIGAEEVLGDVVVSSRVHFDCTTTFAAQPWAHAVYNAPQPPGTPSQLADAIANLLPINAAHLPADLTTRPLTAFIFTDAAPISVLTTDFFAFDDAENTYGLRTYDPEAHAVEMDDAVLGLVCSTLTSPPNWLSIRNASDPQVPKMATVSKEATWASKIYLEYGYYTSVGSLLVAWAYILG
jgi:nucleoside phosphorylase